MECYDGSVLHQSAVFELFDARLPVAGTGGLLTVFGGETFLWEDSCMVSADLEGLSRRQVPQGVNVIRIFRQTPQQQTGPP